MTTELLASTATMPLVLLDWRPMVRGVLRGFATVRLGRSLVIKDITVCASNGKIWATLPSKPMVASDGSVLRDAKNKVRYAAILEWTDRDTQSRFSLAVIEAVRAAHGPEALEPDA